MTRILIIEDVPANGARAKISLMNAGFRDDEVDFWCVAGGDGPDQIGAWETDDGEVQYRRLSFLSAVREIESTEAEVGIFDLRLGGHDADGTGNINLVAWDFVKASGDQDLAKYLETKDFRTITAGLCLIKQFGKDKTRRRGVLVCSHFAVWAGSFLETLVGLDVSPSVSLEIQSEERIAEEVTRMLESLKSPDRDWFARGELLAERMPQRLVNQMSALTERDPHIWDPNILDRMCWWYSDELVSEWRRLAVKNGFVLVKNQLTHNRLKGIANRRATTGGLLASFLEVAGEHCPGFLQQLDCSAECRVALRVNGTNVQSIEDLSHAVGLRSRDSLRAGNGEWLSLKDEARLAYICLAFGGGRDVRIEATCNKGALILEGTGHELSRPFVGCFAGRNLRKCDCEKWIEGEATTLPKYAVARSGDLLNTLRVLHEDRGFTVYQLASLPMVGELEEAITITDGDMWEMLVNKATVGRCGGVYAADLTQNRTRFRISLIAE